MKQLQWFERQFSFGLPSGMLPFYIERLEGTLVRIENKVYGIPEELLSHKHNGKWSVKQNIGHLGEVDEISLKRIEEMIKGVPTLSSAVFEPKLDYNIQPIKTVIQSFIDRRVKIIERYKSIEESDLTKSSLHPRLRVMLTPVDLAWFDAEHDDHHLVTINNILKQKENENCSHSSLR